MTTYAQLLGAASARLAGKGIQEGRLDSEYLLASVLSLPRLELMLRSGETATDDVIQAFQLLIDRRINHEPLQYILGQQPFMGYPFKCDPRALIPRPETELMCDRAIKSALALAQPARLLDLCCGTGCIGLSMALMVPFAQVTLTDLSQDALSLARENAQALGVKARFLRGNLFEPLQGCRFDMIISNPPYVSLKVYPTLAPEVLKEPSMALRAKEDGLAFYRAIAAQAPLYLNPGGIIWLEVGHDQALKVAVMMADHFNRVTIHNDYNRIPRMISGVLKAQEEPHV